MTLDVAERAMRMFDTPQIARLAASLGLDETTTAKALAAATEAIGASLSASSGTADGADRLSTVFRAINGDTIEKFRAKLGGPQQGAAIAHGLHLLDSVIGEAGSRALRDRIAKSAGLSAELSRQLLGIAAPAAFAALSAAGSVASTGTAESAVPVKGMASTTHDRLPPAEPPRPAPPRPRMVNVGADVVGAPDLRPPRAPPAPDPGHGRQSVPPLVTASAPTADRVLQRSPVPAPKADVEPQSVVRRGQIDPLLIASVVVPLVVLLLAAGLWWGLAEGRQEQAVVAEQSKPPQAAVVPEPTRAVPAPQSVVRADDERPVAPPPSPAAVPEISRPDASRISEPSAEREVAAQSRAEAERVASEKQRAEAEARARVETERVLAAERAASAQREAAAAAKAKTDAATEARHEAELAACQRQIDGAIQSLHVAFGRAQAAVPSASHDGLHELARALSSCPSGRLTVEGHSDAEGTAERKQRISERRSLAVADFLVTVGVDRTRLKTVALADSRPIAPNDTAADRALNRRVEFVFESQ